MCVSAMFAISSQRQRSQGADRRLLTKKVVRKTKVAKPRLLPVQPSYSPQGLASPRELPPGLYLWGSVLTLLPELPDQVWYNKSMQGISGPFSCFLGGQGSQAHWEVAV